MKFQRERMSSVDTAWLRMQQPTNLMMVTGVMIFTEPLDLDDLKKVLSNSFLSYERFKQRAVEDYRGAYWETDAHFDLDAQVQLVGLPGSADKAELEALVSRLASTPLDPTRPLWQFHLIDRFQGGSALIMRLHHCYADGIALIGVLLSMTETSPTHATGARIARESSDTDDEEPSFLQTVYQPATRWIEDTVYRGFRLWENGLHLMLHPSEATDLAMHGFNFATELARVTVLPSDPKTRLKAPLSTQKQAAWSEPHPLREVKVIGKALGCTINDVLLSTAAGAIGAYLRDQGDEISNLEIRASVPVNLRSAEETETLGNHFGIVFVTLPIGISAPLERLFKVHEHMKTLKDSYQPIVSFGVLSALGMVPGLFEQPVLNLFSSKASLVVSNVPGPQYPLYFGGREVSQILFWVPQNGQIGVGVSILSYNNQVQFGIIADRNLIPAPGDVVKRFAREFEKLVLTVTLGPMSAASWLNS